MKNLWMVRALSKTLTLTSSFTRSLCSSTTSALTFAIKNVTKSNFESTFGDLRRIFRDAVFISVDLEMTGVTSAPWRESFEFDRFNIRYLKVKDSAEKFVVVQLVSVPSVGTLRSNPSLLTHFTLMENLRNILFTRQEDDAMRTLHIVYDDELLELRCNSREARDTPVVRIAGFLFTERMKNRISEWRDGLLLNRIAISDSQRRLSRSLICGCCEVAKNEATQPQ